MISEALGLFELPNPSGTLESTSLMISEALGLFGLATPCVTRDRFLDDF
jgi:topoisomerase IA-like protein